MGSEDDSGLAGKVALISGGGAAGDGIGNGRAAAILLARAGVLSFNEANPAGLMADVGGAEAEVDHIRGTSTPRDDEGPACHLPVGSSCPILFQFGLGRSR